MKTRVLGFRVAVALLALVAASVSTRSVVPAEAVGLDTIATIAGNGATGYSGDGGLATGAELAVPTGIALDGAGNLYIADNYNCRVRKVSGGGIITTVAGNGTCGYGGDGGPAAFAELNHPNDVPLDGAGNLYIADLYNCRVREVSGGIITTVAGNGTCGYAGDGGPATAAELFPFGVALDGAGNLYIADGFHCVVREVSGGSISTVAGNGTCGWAGDGGPAISAELSGPIGVVLDGAGNLYIGDFVNCRVREVSGGTITTIAGNGTCGYGGDGGPATSAALNTPDGVALDGAGNLYIADDNGCRVREVSGGIITTVAGNGTCLYAGDGGLPTGAELAFPNDVEVDGAGNLYIADTWNYRVREVFACSAATDPDCNADVDFSDPGAAQACVQDHAEDANGDGYSDSDELTPKGAPTCTGAFPASGGLGLSGLSSSSITAACPGRAPGTQGAKIARADLNLDGKVNLLDLGTAAGWFGQAVSSRNDSRAEADQNGDGKINLLDLGTMAGVFGQSVPAC